jgi:hypothetical protein
MAPIWRFWHLFLGAHIFVRNFKMMIFLHILEEKTQKNLLAKKQNSKWRLNSRWPPKLILVVKTTSHLFSKKKHSDLYYLPE